MKKKSRYQQGGPSFRYSDLLRSWQEAVKRGDEARARELGAEHTYRYLKGEKHD